MMILEIAFGIVLGFIILIFMLAMLAMLDNHVKKNK